MKEPTLEEWKADRREALMSLDKTKILAYFKKYDITPPEKEIVFWGAVHKAVTGATDLPLKHRRASKDWLTKRGFKSLDDGDL